MIINAAGYTHTSVAILDALQTLSLPVIEVHLSNPARREDFRHVSYISKAASGVIAGLGVNSYLLAVDAVADLLKVKNEGQVQMIGKKPGIDAAAIRELSELLSETGLTEIEIEHNGGRIRVSRAATSAVAAAGPAAAPAASASAPAAPAAVSGPHPGAVPSPMVGTVYLAPEPGKPDFVKIGQSVKEGDTLFIVEAMKTMNPIAAPRAGTVIEISVSNGQPVEYGQTLLILG